MSELLHVDAGTYTFILHALIPRPTEVRKCTMLLCKTLNPFYIIVIFLVTCAAVTYLFSEKRVKIKVIFYFA